MSDISILYRHGCMDRRRRSCILILVSVGNNSSNQLLFGGKPNYYWQKQNFPHSTGFIYKLPAIFNYDRSLADPIK